VAAFIAACIWVIAAWFLSVVLSAKQSWPAAYGLIAAGVPILFWLGLSAGWGTAAVGFIVGCLVLRWPVIYAGRWIRRRFRRE
jgi:hypothetical protein